LKGKVFGEYAGVETKQKKDGSGSYNMVKIGDSTEYEKVQMFLASEVQVNGLQIGQKVVADINLIQRGYQYSVACVGISSQKAQEVK